MNQPSIVTAEHKHSIGTETADRNRKEKTKNREQKT